VSLLVRGLVHRRQHNSESDAGRSVLEIVVLPQNERAACLQACIGHSHGGETPAETVPCIAAEKQHLLLLSEYHSSYAVTSQAISAMGAYSTFLTSSPQKENDEGKGLAMACEGLDPQPGVYCTQDFLQTAAVLVPCSSSAALSSFECAIEWELGAQRESIAHFGRMPQHVEHWLVWCFGKLGSVLGRAYSCSADLARALEHRWISKQSGLG
jgi:hypothetical protein